MKLYDHNNLLTKKHWCFPVLRMSLIILINTVGAPNQVSLPAFDICNPAWEKYSRTNNRYAKQGQEVCREGEENRALQALSRLCMTVVCSQCVNSPFVWSRERNTDPWATRGLGFMLMSNFHQGFCLLPFLRSRPEYSSEIHAAQKKKTPSDTVCTERPALV